MVDRVSATVRDPLQSVNPYVSVLALGSLIYFLALIHASRADVVGPQKFMHLRGNASIRELWKS